MRSVLSSTVSGVDPLPSLRSPGMTLGSNVLCHSAGSSNRTGRSGAEGKGIHGAEPRLLSHYREGQGW
jgi:hypothetical protein